MAFKKCSAGCRFCSEKLIHQDSRIPPGSLCEPDFYLQRLEETLAALENIPMGYSISGLEASVDPDNLLRAFEILISQAKKSPVTTRVVYTNGSGFVSPQGGEKLISGLQKFNPDHLEISRHHFDSRINQSIVCFARDEQIQDGAVFEDMVKKIATIFQITLVCVAQKGGIDSAGKVKQYIQWAHNLGIRSVVFRELAKLGEGFTPNPAFNYIKTHRASMEDILTEIGGDKTLSREFSLSPKHRGYYYWSVDGTWNNKSKVSFESSDYREMEKRHNSGKVYKLVLHPNGNLTSGWDAGKNIIIHGSK